MTEFGDNTGTIITMVMERDTETKNTIRYTPIHQLEDGMTEIADAVNAIRFNREALAGFEDQPERLAVVVFPVPESEVDQMTRAKRETAKIKAPAVEAEPTPTQFVESPSFWEVVKDLGWDPTTVTYTPSKFEDLYPDGVPIATP